MLLYTTHFLINYVRRRSLVLESKFQKDLIDEIKFILPGSIILKNDPNYIQGIPDLTVFFKDRWATLEVKKTAKASHQPNQDHYVELMNQMSFSAFIYPENKEEVLYAMERALQPIRKTRVSKRV